MQFEAGKYYRTRGGHKAIVSAIVPPSPDGRSTYGYPMFGYVLGGGEWVERSWTQEGRFLLDGQEHDLDLVAPWVDPPEVKVELAERDSSPCVLVTIGGQTFAHRYDGLFMGQCPASMREPYTNIRPYEPASRHLP